MVGSASCSTLMFLLMQDRALPVSPTSPATPTSPAFFRTALIRMDRFPNVCCLAWRVSGRDDSEDSRSRSPLSTRYKHYLFVMSSNVISISAGQFFQCPPASKGDHHSLREKQVEDALVSEVFLSERCRHFRRRGPQCCLSQDTEPFRASGHGAG